jgi:flagellar biosynthesis chaperone FliJ
MKIETLHKGLQLSNTMRYYADYIRRFEDELKKYQSTFSSIETELERKITQIDMNALENKIYNYKKELQTIEQEFEKL